MSDSNVVVGNEEELGEGVLTSFEADDNQPNLVEQVEQVTNKKEYLIETMRDKTAEELAHFEVYKELLASVQLMEETPHSPRDLFPSKAQLVEELQNRKEKHLREHQFYEQLLGVMLVSPDTDEKVLQSVSQALPPIYRYYWVDNNGNKIYYSNKFYS